MLAFILTLTCPQVSIAPSSYFPSLIMKRSIFFLSTLLSLAPAKVAVYIISDRGMAAFISESQRNRSNKPGKLFL